MDRVYAAARREVWDRADGLCEAGWGPDCAREMQQVHHVRGRGGPSPHDVEWLLGVCEPCHRRIHGNPQDARNRGFMASRHRSSRL